MIWVTQVEYLGDYRLKLAFSDGLIAMVDLEPTIRNDARRLFRELADLEGFRRHRLDMDTVVWENGLDLAPEYLHSLAEQMPIAA
jgi:hypothetical protein